MTIEMESAPSAQDGSEPTGQVGASGGQRPSGDAPNLQAVLERLNHVEKLAQSLQGDKDRGVKKALHDVDELRKSFGDVQAMMKKGLTEDEAFEQLEGRKAEDEFKRAVLEVRDLLKGGTSLSAQASGADKSGYIAQAVAEADLPADDPRVTDWMRNLPPEIREDADKLLAEAVRFKKKLASPPPNPSAVSPQGSPPPPAPDAKVIEAKIARLNKMYKNPSAYKAELPAMEKELEGYLPK